jgi:lysyl-tRNA synthetase class 2
VSHDEQTHVRLEKLAALRHLAINPYGGAFPKSMSLERLVAAYEEGRSVETAGRLTAKRGHGGLTFADLRDATGKVQICLKEEKVGPDAYRLFGELDLGDILGVRGTLFQTKTGEVTVQVETLALLAKALRPLPEKWHGLKDIEVRYRQRYLDLIANEPVRKVFLQRSRLITSLRASLERQGFIEVETPMMHAIPGGAAGEPFKTHHNVLDADLYLRLAPELHLKKLLVGGFEKVYELNRCFRNEGVSMKHNPEFTMLEAYEAYGDVASMMRLVETLITEAAKALLGGLTCEYRGQPIDLSPPWDTVSFAETMRGLGLEPNSPLERLQQALQAKGMNVAGLSRSQMVRLVEQLFDPKAKTKPLFVTDYWTELSPLAKAKPGDPNITERFELYIGGMEVANAYSELNDPIEQRKRFETQLEGEGSRVKGGGESHSTLHPSPSTRRGIDESFVEALEYGMPPAGGLGVGVDRLAMLFFDQPSIKDVILFPLLKPQGAGA